MHRDVCRGEGWRGDSDRAVRVVVMRQSLEAVEALVRWLREWEWECGFVWGSECDESGAGDGGVGGGCDA